MQATPIIISYYWGPCPELDHFKGCLVLYCLCKIINFHGTFSGIMCRSHLNDILDVALGNAGVARRVGRYVAQKYIERPLIIYDTKFDIRQWFLVTDWNPLTMWMYQVSGRMFGGFSPDPCQPAQVH